MTEQPQPSRCTSDPGCKGGYHDRRCPLAVALPMCACGRMAMSGWTWMCTLCYMQKEIGYAVSELERGGEAWPGRTWQSHALERLVKLRDMR